MDNDDETHKKSITTGNCSRAFSAFELANLKLPRYPTTPKGWYSVVKNEGWGVREEPGKGPGGMRRTFVPPPEVQALIDARLNDESTRPIATEESKASKAKQMRIQNILTGLHAYQKYDNRESNLPEITLPLYPEIAEKIGVALAQTYGLGYNSLNISIRTDLFSALYSALCLLGANQEAAPSDEEVKAMLAMAIRFGKTPAPANADS